MGAIRQNLIFVIAIAGAVASSQLPEFAQQYRQRIGGVVDELGRTVDEFDRDAASNGLDRQQALELHARDHQPLFHARGKSMEISILRLDTLRKQQADFASAGPLTQPLVLAYSDTNTLKGTWGEFRPAMPMTTSGLAWLFFGFLFGAFIAFVIGRVVKWIWLSSARVVRAKKSAPV